jgi:hypothetical protein
MSVKSEEKKQTKAVKSLVGQNGNAFPGVEKVKQLLFLNGIWNATLTEDNNLYIEVVRGQMINKENWEAMKTMAAVPEALKDALDGYYTADWSVFK